MKKGITEAGPLRVHNKELLVPVFDARSDEFQTYQSIPPDGAPKKFPPDGVKKGGYVVVGLRTTIRQAVAKKDESPFVICEGYATGYAIYKATFLDYHVISAMDCGNLQPVAEAMRRRYPLRKIIIAADNDIKDDGSNPGVESANRGRASGAGGCLGRYTAAGGLLGLVELERRRCC